MRIQLKSIVRDFTQAGSNAAVYGPDKQIWKENLISTSACSEAPFKILTTFQFFYQIKYKDHKKKHILL